MFWKCCAYYLRGKSDVHGLHRVTTSTNINLISGRVKESADSSGERSVRHYFAVISRRIRSARS